MKQFLLILSIFIFNSSFGQVDNYDLLTKNIMSSNVKTITKYQNSKKFPNGEKEFKLEFNKEGQLVSLEEYEYPMGPENPIVMKQEIKYDEDGRKVLTHIRASGGSTSFDTLIYDDQNVLIKKQRIANGQVVRTMDYSNKIENNDEQKVLDDKGNLVKLTDSDGDYTTYEYDSNRNLSQEIEFQDGEEHTKYIFKYNNNGRLTNMETYLLYIGDGTKATLTYYFEYEEFK